MNELHPQMPLIDLCDQDRGIRYGILKVGNFDPGGIPVIRGGDIKSGKVTFDPNKKVTEEISNQFSRTLLQGGEIVINLIGEAGHSAVVPLEYRGFNVTRDVAVIPLSKGVDTRFIDFYLRSTSVIEWFRQRLQGSVTQKINLETLREVPVFLPPLKEQKAIAHILGTLDDKIELNRKTNETLEAMAKALFKSWFMDFDPVRAKAEGRPTGLPVEISDLFPDSFDDSELGEIPSGWKIASLGEEFNWKEGKPWNKEDRVEQSAISVFGANGSIGFSAKQMGDTRVIFVGKIGSCGAINYHNGSFWATNNTHFLALDENPFLEYARQALGVIDFSQYIGGSSNPYMPFGNFAHHQILSPPLDILRIFCDCVTPLRESIEQSEEKSTTMCSLRNALLPKLISGEIRIPDAEQMLEEVGI
jgi:type I restriction enzyme S subunit